MWKLTALAVCLFVSLSSGSDVLDLTDETYKNVVDNAEIILVEFFAPWCGHCKKLAPEYEEAATKLKAADPPVPIAKVDCTEGGKEVCSKEGVSGYPTLKVYRNGQFAQDYDGERNAAGIVATMKKLSGPSSLEIKEVAKMDSKLAAAEDVVIVGFYEEDNANFKTFMSSADKLGQDFTFYHSQEAAVLEHYGYKNVIVLFRPSHLHAKFENAREVFDREEFVFTNVEDFVEGNVCGLVGHMRPHSEKYFKKPLVTAYYLVDYKRNAKGTNYYRNRVARVAKKFVGKVYFSIAAKSDYNKKLEDFQFGTSTDDVVIAATNAKGENFLMREDFSVPALETFVNEIVDGKVKPYLKSEDIPETNDGPVKIVVAETFQTIVNDPSKDVLVEFYAPWCGHCKTLEPKFDELGEKLKGVDHVVIAKMDATANDVPSEYTVTGFPTIYWASKDGKTTPKKYEGAREVEDFVKFIKAESSEPFELTAPKKKSKKSKKSKSNTDEL